VVPARPPDSSTGAIRLEEVTSLLKATLDATADGILVVDENGKTVVFNRQFAALWRISPEAAASGQDDVLIGEVLAQLENPAAFVRRVMEIYSDQEKEALDTLVFKDGRRFERRSMPRRIGGRYAGRVWSFRDVTDLVRTEQQLARAHSLLRATLDATADGILVVDNDGDLVDFNRKVVEMWGIPSEVVTSFDRHRLRAWVSDQVKNPGRFLKKVAEDYSEPKGRATTGSTGRPGVERTRSRRRSAIRSSAGSEPRRHRGVAPRRRSVPSAPASDTRLIVDSPLGTRASAGRTWCASVRWNIVPGGMRAEHAGGPRPRDVETLDAILAAFYDVISGPAGRRRDWERDRALYLPGARQVATGVREGNPFALAMDHEAYVARADEIFRRDGFFEREIHRVVRRFGNLAHVLSTYESRHEDGGPVFARGVNSIDLYFDGKRWWIASAVWDSERPDNPIPPDWLPP
jgi:PAS domain-containing protein